MQDVRINRSLSYEEQVLFQRYHIVGYDFDAGGVRGGATSTNAELPSNYDNHQGLSGDTHGYGEG